jgi:hypothetical protein
MSGLVKKVSQGVKFFKPVRAMMLSAQASMAVQARVNHKGLEMSLDRMISLLGAPR